MCTFRGGGFNEIFLASLLFDCIEDQDYRSLTTLLSERNVDPNIIIPKKGISPFHLAVGSDPLSYSLKITKLLLQHGGDPNVRSLEGVTPLHVAASWGRVELLRLLLLCGGDPEIKDFCRKNALHYAIAEENTETVALIEQFIKDQHEFILANRSSKIGYSVTLDKLVINNGHYVGEYDVKDEPKSTIQLDDLPKTNSNQYVLDWCESQYLDKSVQNVNGFNSTGTSAESHHLTESFSWSSRKCERSHVVPMTEFQNTFSSVWDGKDTYSKESGILTLPESLDNSADKSFEEDNAGEKIQEIRQSVKIGTAKEISSDREFSVVASKNKDTSSDYCTCTSGSDDVNPLERNIFEISSLTDFNSSVKHYDDETGFVSVCEVFKYEDVEEGVVLYEKKHLVSNELGNNDSIVSSVQSKSTLPSSFCYESDALRKELKNAGCDCGPITKTTKRVYLKKLYHIKKKACCVTQGNVEIKEKVYSSELQTTLEDINTTCYSVHSIALENSLTKQFSNPDPTRRWREGTNKVSFTYLLLDPRVTKNLPSRSEKLSKCDTWKMFLSAIFYVGKGKRTRPYSHLYSALTCYNNQTSPLIDDKKSKYILDIWRNNYGVVCLHVFQHVIPVEAYTREAAIISALKLDNLTNVKPGNFYGLAATWSTHEKNLFGTYLLHKAMNIFLNEGERQLFPTDIC